MKRNKRVGEYCLPSEIGEGLFRQPLKQRTGVAIQWTQEQDAAILAGWKRMSRATFTIWFKDTYGLGSIDSIGGRYRHLVSTKKSASA